MLHKFPENCPQCFLAHIKKVRGGGTWCVGYFGSRISPLDRREGNPSILALTGNCWPRFMAGGRFGRHFAKERFGSIGTGGSGPCRGEQFTLPSFETDSPAFSFPRARLLCLTRLWCSYSGAAHIHWRHHPYFKVCLEFWPRRIIVHVLGPFFPSLPSV